MKRRLQLLTVLACVAAACLAQGRSANAAPVISFPFEAGYSLNNTTDTTAQFQVWLRNPDATPIQVNAFGYTVHLTDLPTPGYEFNAVDFDDPDPDFYTRQYIFDGNSLAQTLNQPLTIEDPILDFPNLTFSAFDQFDNGDANPNNDYAIVNPGEIFSLGTITMTIPAGGPDFSSARLIFDPNFTDITVTDGINPPFNLNPGDGSLLLTNARIGVAPEPSSVLLFGAAGALTAAVLAVRRWRRAI